MARTPLVWLVGSALLGTLTAACGEDSPSVLDAHANGAERVVTIWWIMFGLGTFVFLLVVATLLLALFWGCERRQATSAAQADRRTAWLVAGGGVVLPLIILFALMGLTLWSLTPEDEPNDPIVVEVTGRQWFWEVAYPDSGVMSVNEVHMPAGARVRFNLTSGDVIHSFWVPQLHGKRDMIPGQTNTIWIEASDPGTYRGQCAEFCGLQHANMILQVIVEEDRDAFERWLQEQAEQDQGDGDGDGARGDGTGGMQLEIATLEDLTFDTRRLTAPPDASVTVSYLNDTDIPHNIRFFAGDSPDAASIAATEVVTGRGEERTITFTTPSNSGQYFYHCDVHPQQMTGFLVVE